MPTVADAMVTHVKVSPPDVTVRELRALFADDHVHVAVIARRGVLLAVVDRTDLERRPDNARAVAFGALASRTVGPGADADETRRALLGSGRRRLAVVAEDGRLLGLLCLKRSRRGFCSDRDVSARSAERALATLGG
ncbi:CBS domain-containing protein [Jatrophihabitans sp. YIM 134969]